MKIGGRLIGRVVAGSAAFGFAGLAYAYLTLPDVRPLASTNPATTAFMELRAREAALLRPLLQDLRSGDGTVRVRAHEALCAWAGKDLPFRANGSDAEREADAAAIEKSVLR